jgi:hypothetical protein
MARSRFSFYLYLTLATVAIVGIVAVNVLHDTPVQQPDIYQSIRRGNLSEIEAYLANGGDPDLRLIVPNGEEWPLLKIALVDREEDVALRLLEAGADLPSSEMLRGGFGDAANDGLIKVLEYLLARDTTALPPGSSYGISGAISGAAFRGYYDAVELLLDHIDTEESDWRTTLRVGAFAAMAIGYDDVALLLTEGGADLDQVLHVAVRYSSPGMIRYLLGRGADPMAPLPPDPTLPEDWPRTPIEFAFQRWREQGYIDAAVVNDGSALPEEYRDRDAALVLFELIRAGATLDGAADAALDGIRELTMLERPSERLVTAARLGFLDVVQSLLSGEPGMISRDDLRQAVVVALQKDHDDIARWLLASGAPADGGPLHVAAAASSPGMVRYLLQLGADPSEEFLSKTPLEYWLEIQATADKAGILHELVVGGADACWLVDHWDDFDSLVQSRLKNSAASCW